MTRGGSPRRGAATVPTPPSFVGFARADVESSIPARFARQRAAHGGRLAVAAGDGRLTYDELDRRADHVARAILARLGPGSEPVAVAMEKGAALVAAILGVLKAGKFYVPLDPSFPAARNAAALGDCGARLLVTGGAAAAGAGVLAGGADVLHVGALADDRGGSSRSSRGASGPGALDADGRPAGEAPAVDIAPSAVAYVIYTSGSTGRPKGVVQTHRNVLHNVANLTNGLRLCRDDRVSLVPSCAVGASVSSLFGALLNGAAVVVFDPARDGLAALAERMESERVTVFHAVPSLFRALCASLGEGGGVAEHFPALRLIKLGGEAVTAADLALYKRHFGRGCVFHVGLGTTEVNVVRQFFADHETEVDGVVPVGYAVEGTDVVLIDDSGREVAPGEAGEIAVRGDYLPLGYWNRPDLTAAAFGPDPRPGGRRVYRTGDVGRMAADGCLTHLGRLDSRVKVRGQAVEIAEVESALLACAGVGEAAVVARPDGEGGTRLEAFVAPAPAGVEGAPPAPLSPAALREVLAASLPGFMVPSTFVALAALPRLPNGKVDRAALRDAPPAGRAAGVPGADEVADGLGAGTAEARLAAIWRDALKVARVGARDDFFELGGDSLAALVVMSGVERAFGPRLPASALLEARTVERLAALLARGEERGAACELVPLTEGARGGDPIFLLPTLGGDVFRLRDLAGHLGGARDVFGIRCVAEGDWHGSAAGIAARCAEALRAARPDGVFHLAGHSFGGVLAVEVARALAGSGKQVGLVALLDTYGPGHRKLSRPRRALRRLRAFLRARPEERRAYARSLASQLAARARVATGAAGLDAAGLDAAGLDAAAPESAPPLEGMHLRASRSYAPAPYPGRVALFRAERQRVAYPDDPTLGWGRVAASVSVTAVPGDHSSVILEPNVAHLARALLDALQDCEAEGPLPPVERHADAVLRPERDAGLKLDRVARDEPHAPALRDGGEQ